MRTALVRDWNGNLKIMRYDCYTSNKEFAEDLHGNDFRVLKIWARNASEGEIEDWLFWNRKN